MPDFGRWTSNGGDPSLNEINRADRFLDALANDQPVYSTDPGEAELAFLLSDWRDGVRDAPLSAVVTPRDAAIALRDGLASSSRKRSRTSLALVGSVAAGLLCLGGFSAAVYGSGPGDAFYGIRSMFFGQNQQTRDDQVVLAAQTELAQVQQLIQQGDWQQAQDKLVTLSTTVQSVDQVERKQELIEQYNALTYKVVEQDPAATLPPPGEPPPVLPSSPLTLLQVPVIEDTTVSTSTSATTSSSSSSSTSTSTSPSAIPPSDLTIATTTTATTSPSPEPPTTVTSTSTSPPPTSQTPTSAQPPPSTATSTVTTTSTTISRDVAVPPMTVPPSPVAPAPPAIVAPPSSVAPAPPAVVAPPSSVAPAPAIVAPPSSVAPAAPVAPPSAVSPPPVSVAPVAPPKPREPEQVVTSTVTAPTGRGGG